MAERVVEAACRTCGGIRISQRRIGSAAVAGGADAHIARIGCGMGGLSGNAGKPGFSCVGRIDAAAVTGGSVHTGGGGSTIESGAMAGLAG